MECFPRDGGLLGVDDALAQILSRITPLASRETVALHDALDRVCAQDISANFDIPGADNSAMDGYAFRYADLDHRGPTSLPLSQRIVAGAAPTPLLAGTAARIFTGAWLPPGADTVVMQEDAVEQNGCVEIRPPVAAGQFVRRCGEDVRSGTSPITRGTRLQASHIGLLAAMGYAVVAVTPKVRIGIITTGSELVEPGLPLRPGQLYNANASLLQALCRRAGADVVISATVADDLAATTTLLRNCAQRCDLLLTSGGASVGEEDHIKAAIEQCGDVELWRIALKPGKPLLFGHVGAVPVLGLPGNPVSTFVTFLLFANAIIGRMQDAHGTNSTRLHLPAAFAWPKASARREYARARLIRDVDGITAVSLFHDQNSHLLSSLTWADGLAVIPANSVVHNGATVEFISFKGVS